MKAFLKLIRWQNLLIVILTMVLMRYFVLEPLISKIGIVLAKGNGEVIPMVIQFSLFDFILLVAAVVFITAGEQLQKGYCGLQCHF